MATISKIEIEGFKAFPKLFSLELGEHNLLMYGENGSGKSSIYYALHALLQSVFKDDKGAKYFKTIEDSSTGEGSFVSDENLVNIYRSDDVKKNVFQPYIKITLDNGNVWKLDRGGLLSASGENYREIRRLNTTTVFINHSYISRFHSARNSENIDLWNVFVKDILPFCAKSDEEKSLADIYYEIIAERPKGKAEIDNLKKRIQSFNGRLFNDVIGEINKKATDTYNQYFKNEGDSEIVITLRYFADDDETNNPLHEEYYLAFDKFHGSQYSLRYPRIGIDVVSDSQPIYKPQSFFNEAKLTAIALSVRFALLNLDNPDDGSFLALDDMLISLDMSNRMKVVKYLLEVVANKYKIYLFTHDRSLFELIKEIVKAKDSEYSKSWLFKEIYNDDNVSENPKCFNSDDAFTRALFHFKKFDYPASANYLRKSVEEMISLFPPYISRNEDGLEKEKLRNKIEAAKALLKNADGYIDDIQDVILSLNTLLNPLSHRSIDTNVYRIDLIRVINILPRLKQRIIDLEFKEVIAIENDVFFCIDENDHVKCEIKIKLKLPLYSYTGADGNRKFSVANGDSIESVTIKDGVKEEPKPFTYYKKLSLEEICKNLHEYLHKTYTGNYQDFYRDKDENSFNTLL